jgi:hypothetical protein
MRRHGLAVGVLLALMAAVPVPYADSAVVGRVDEIDCDPSPTELEDIGFIAERDGIPLDEAIARHGWQGCFVEVVNYLQGAYPDRYAGAAITDGGRGAWIAFKGDVPEEAAELAEAIPVGVQLIGGRGFSEAELDEVFLAVYYDIFGHEDVEAASGGYEIETGVITIQVQLRDGLEDPARRERLREVFQAEQPANTAITVEVIFFDELGGVDDASAGDAGGVPRPAVYAGLLAAAVLALLAGLLGRRRRRRAPRIPRPTGSGFGTLWLASTFYALAFVARLFAG